MITKVSVVVLSLIAVIAFAVMVIMVCAAVAVVSCCCHQNQTVINGKLNNFKCACINNIILF